MNMVGTENILIDLIDVGARLREVDADYVALIAGSMADIGQMTPIEVRPLKGGAFELVAGAHRVAAGQLLGWTEIAATVRDLSDLEAELRQIDENLVRRELSPFDRATFLARRQEVYIGLHPETAQGTAGANTRWMQVTRLSFASEAAAKVGVSKRDIMRSIARFKNIVADVREKIAGTWIANNGAALDALARAEPSEQRKAITVMLRPEKPIKSVNVALLLISGGKTAPRDVDAEQLGRLLRAWKDAGRQAREQFFEQIKSEAITKYAASWGHK